MLVDGDSHFYEPSSLWRDHLSSTEKRLALSVDADELGYSHLTYAGRSLQMVVPTFPSNLNASGEVRKRRAAGLPCEKDLYDHVPRNYWDVEARLALIESWNVDRSILFPQFQGLVDSYLVDEVEAAHANMEAWNRWVVEVVEQTGGRLVPVGHVRLDADLDWAVREIRRLGAGGARFVTFVPGLVGGKPPSHPDNEVVWRAFTDSRVTPTWHITPGYRYAVANVPAWEGDSGYSPVTGMFLNVGSQLALGDMIFNGVFDRHPDLRVLLAELGVDWVPQFLAEMDLRQRTVDRQQGHEHGAKRRSPSETFHEHVLSVVSCPTDRDIRTLLETRGRGLAYGSDYPHGCSSTQPVAQIRAEIDGTLDQAQQSDFLGGNLAPLLG
jgi:uncharacterized protein